MMPACVYTCPAKARLFGNLKDPESTIGGILKDKRINVLKPETGNEPRVYYVGLDKEVK
jgi:tetrathionate reductase subunit B